MARGCEETLRRSSEETDDETKGGEVMPRYRRKEKLAEKEFA
jgi:hypothetical protein